MSAENSPLGKPSAYVSQYDPSLLFPIARQGKRAELGIGDDFGTLPFFGVDLWNAYELSWLNLRGKPQVAIARVMVPADSPNIIESKSFKLYLNSFRNVKIFHEHVINVMLEDFVKACDPLSVEIEGDFNVRGNIKTTVRANYRRQNAEGSNQ